MGRLGGWEAMLRPAPLDISSFKPAPKAKRKISDDAKLF